MIFSSLEVIALVGKSLTQEPVGLSQGFIPLDLTSLLWWLCTYPSPRGALWVASFDVEHLCLFPFA